MKGPYVAGLFQCLVGIIEVAPEEEYTGIKSDELFAFRLIHLRSGVVGYWRFLNKAVWNVCCAIVDVDIQTKAAHIIRRQPAAVAKQYKVNMTGG